MLLLDRSVLACQETLSQEIFTKTLFHQKQSILVRDFGVNKNLLSSILLLIIVVGGFAITDTTRFGTAQAASEAPPARLEKTYGPIAGYSIMQTADGGYTIAGHEGVWYRSRGPGYFTNITTLLIKTDSSGQVQWQKNYPRVGLSSAVLTSDGGYALVGVIGNSERSLAKVDSEGNVQWSKNYSAASDCTFRGVVQTQDGGYAIAGYANPGYGSEGRLLKIDANGNLQWNKTYGAALEYNSFHSLVEAEDGGFAMAGITGYQSHGDLDGWLVKTDSMGNLEWEKRIGGAEWDYGSSLILTADGGYLLAGSTESFGAGDSDGWLVKTDSQGKVMWNLAYGSTGRDKFTSVAQTADGGYVAAGTFNAQFKSSSATVVVKLDSLGNVTWAIEHQNRHNQLSSIIGTQDGGYAFTGYKALGRYPEITDIWFVKNTLPSDFQGAPSGFQATLAPPEPPEPFLNTFVAASIITVAVVGVGLLVYFKKRKH
jgi:hypothetical protein